PARLTRPALRSALGTRDGGWRCELRAASRRAGGVHRCAGPEPATVRPVDPAARPGDALPAPAPTRLGARHAGRHHRVLCRALPVARVARRMGLWTAPARSTAARHRAARLRRDAALSPRKPPDIRARFVPAGAHAALRPAAHPPRRDREPHHVRAVSLEPGTQ